MTNSAKVVASRDIKFYHTPYSSTNVLPADTVTWDQAWGTPAGQAAAWVDAGFTQGGPTFSAEIARAEIRMDQSLDPVLRPATGRTVTMGAQLGEFDLDTLTTATGQGSVATLAATTAARGYDEWSMGSTVADNFYSAAIDVLHGGDDEAIRLVLWYAQPTGAQQWTFAPETPALTPFLLTALPDPSNGNRVATIRDLTPIAA
ncbi:MAG: hypothetical protein AB7P40_00305 [Chloroflexota bacterium]